jgi:diguanylate cyclase (GGDEF)-like protein
MRSTARSGAVVVGALLVALAVAVPEGGARDTLWLVCGWGAVVAVALGVLRYQPPTATAWLLLAAGIASNVAGDSIALVVVPHPSAADGTVYLSDGCYLLAYGFLGASLALFVRRYAAGARDAVLDALIVAAAFAFAAWEAVVEPSLSGAGFAEGLLDAAYPLLDAVLLALLVRLVVMPGRRTPSLWLLIAGVTLLLAHDVGFALVGQHWPEASAPWLAAAWPLHYVAFAAAALHPSMARLVTPQPAEPERVGVARVLVLAAAFLISPVVVVVEQSNGDRVAPGVLLAAQATLTVLVLWRLVALVRERDEARERLVFQARHDELTRLPNRRAFLDALDGALGHEQRGVGLLYVDLDGLKRTNDSHGHAAGDELLLAAARRLCRAVRDDDVVGRIGGDEFAVLVTGLTSDDDLLAVAARVHTELSRPDGEGRATTASVGVARADGRLRDRDALLRAADEAMYRAKRAGSARTAVSAPEPLGVGVLDRA